MFQLSILKFLNLILYKNLNCISYSFFQLPENIAVLIFEISVLVLERVHLGLVSVVLTQQILDSSVQLIESVLVILFQTSCVFIKLLVNGTRALCSRFVEGSKLGFFKTKTFI